MPEVVTELRDGMTLTESYPCLTIRKAVLTAKTTKVKLADVMDDIDSYLKN